MRQLVKLQSAKAALVAVALLLFPSAAAAQSGQHVYTLTISTTVVGSATGAPPGKVLTGAGSGLCPPACTYSLETGTKLALRATANTGAAFRGWQDITICAEYPYVDDTCTVTMGEGDMSAVAVFVQGRGSLSVDSTGDVAIQSTPTGIECASGPQPQNACAATFPLGTKVHLTATPTSPGVSVTRWSSWECAPRATTCDVTVDGIRNVMAFVAPFYITVDKTGDTSSTIVYTRTGYECGPSCRGFRMKLSSAHDVGIQVVDPAPLFTRWSSPCELPTSGLCTFFATQNVTVFASFCEGVAPALQVLCLPQSLFAAEFKPVVVYRQGRGSVEVRWDNNDYYCNRPRCRFPKVPVGVRMTFVAKPASRFSQWSGGICPGRSVCPLKSDLVDAIRGVFRQ